MPLLWAEWKDPSYAYLLYVPSQLCHVGRVYDGFLLTDTGIALKSHLLPNVSSQRKHWYPKKQ